MSQEEIYRCPKCRQYESFLYNSFDEIVCYTHCHCVKKNKEKKIKPLDLAFKKLNEELQQTKTLEG